MPTQPSKGIAHQDHTRASARPATDLPLRSHEELAAWRAVHPSPLDRMSATGLSRFLRGLVLTARGPTSFPLADLHAELTGAEVAAVARLFGLDGHWEGLTDGEARRVSQIVRPAMPTALEHRVDAFEAAIEDLPTHAGRVDRAALVQARFEQEFPPAGWMQLLATADDHDLLLMWRAASSAALRT